MGFIRDDLWGSRILLVDERVVFNMDFKFFKKFDFLDILFVFLF